MRLCVTSAGSTLDSAVDTRFGRCQYFIIVDSDSLHWEAIENPNLETMGGAGIQSAQLIASKDVKAVLTGNVGPNAFQTLTAAGIEIFTGAAGTVKEAIETYKKKGLNAASAPSVSSKAGMPGKNKS